MGRATSRVSPVSSNSRYSLAATTKPSVREDLDLPRGDGLRLNRALWVRTHDVLTALLNGQAPLISKISDIPDGYDAVILACGEGIFDRPDVVDRFDLRPVRGQVEYAPAMVAPHRALSWGGYAVPLDGGVLFGATHERGDRGTDVRDTDRARNLESLAKILPERAAEFAAFPLQSRASIRVMTRDYLPAMGQVSPGLYALTGLGARGFCLAPLLAKALLADIIKCYLRFRQEAKIC